METWRRGGFGGKFSENWNLLKRLSLPKPVGAKSWRRVSHSAVSSPRCDLEPLEWGQQVPSAPSADLHHSHQQSAGSQECLCGRDSGGPGREASWVGWPGGVALTPSSLVPADTIPAQPPGGRVCRGLGGADTGHPLPGLLLHCPPLLHPGPCPEQGPPPVST